jgi:hypothetical protein
MSFSAPTPPSIVLPQPPSTAQAPAAPIGQKPQAKSQQPTYLGSAVAANPTNTGQKTLLGT